VSIRETLQRLVEDEKSREELAKVVAILFDIFIEDWYRWEVMGWILALYLGWTWEELERYPELGWAAKAICAAALLQSPKRKERLLGNALLYHTELPPEELFVLHGGSLIPAVVYHYRRSAEQKHIMDEAAKVAQEVMRRLQQEGKKGDGRTGTAERD